MPTVDDFKPQQMVLSNETLALIMTVVAVTKEGGFDHYPYPQRVEYHYPRAKDLIREYRHSAP